MVAGTVNSLTDGIDVGDVVNEVPPAQVDRDLPVWRALLEHPERRKLERERERERERGGGE